MGLVKPQNREWIIVVGTLARWHTWTHMDRKPWQQMQADASRCKQMHALSLLFLLFLLFLGRKPT